jgi:hypothetical protein
MLKNTFNTGKTFKGQIRARLRRLHGCGKLVCIIVFDSSVLLAF